MSEQNPHGTFLPAGTNVRYDGGRHEGIVEFGIVVHCWLDEEIDGYDCYIAFFGEKRPSGKPSERPYILRYASTSLVVLDQTTSE
jgi:hypothetical protein